MDAIAGGRLDAEIRIVVSNNSRSGALRRARDAGIPTAHLSGATHPDPDALDAAIADALADRGVELVALAGYMKKLGPRTLARFRNRVVNVHPALLPKYGGRGMYGARVHAAVLDAGERETGVTVHLADGEYDRGATIAQSRVPILAGDTPSTLAARVLEREHALYPQTLSRVANGEIDLDAVAEARIAESQKVNEPNNLTYKSAGVDLDESRRLKSRIRDIAARTQGPETLAGVGAFGALYSLTGYDDPVLVASTDPVGTKLKLASMTGRYGGVGEDLVNACVNDVIVSGAKPILFLDYINMSVLRAEVALALVDGMARACAAVGCSLIGGETAEMPGVFADGAFDVSGFVLGAVERSEIIDGSTIKAGDAIIGVPSNGLHTNGYSLVRRVYGLDDDPAPLFAHRAELGETLADALLRPHPPYYNALRPAFGLAKGIAHITGGGLVENVPRILPEGLSARFDASSWRIPPIFPLIQRDGGIADDEMFRVFNMGIGMIIVCENARADETASLIPNAALVGEVAADDGGGRVVVE